MKPTKGQAVDTSEVSGISFIFALYSVPVKLLGFDLHYDARHTVYYGIDINFIFFK